MVMDDQLDFQPGDIILFSGQGAISLFVRAWTLSAYSHVGMVAKVSRENLLLTTMVGGLKLPAERVRLWKPVNLLFESTTADETPCHISGRAFRGVQSHKPLHRIDDYAGSVWRTRLSKEWTLSPSESRLLTTDLLASLGKPYDESRFFLAGARATRPLWTSLAADRTRLFCAEMVAAALMYAFSGREFLQFKPGLLSPASLARKLIKSGIYDEPVKVK